MAAAAPSSAPAVLGELDSKDPELLDTIGELKAALEKDRANDHGEWELLVKHDAARIFRRPREGSSLFEYQTFATVEHSMDMYMEMMMDLEYRKVWDPYVKELTLHDSGMIYWCVSYPFPLSNRDYVFRVRGGKVQHDESEYCVIIYANDTHEEFPEGSGAVRVLEFFQRLVLFPGDNGETRIFVRYFDDPRGSIPSWVINWAAKTAVPKFLDVMDRACRNYPEYKRCKASGEKFKFAK